MKLHLISDEGITRVLCEGPVTYSELASKANALEDLLGVDFPHKKLLLSLEQTSALDTPGISWLLGHHKHFLEQGGKMVICSIPPFIRGMLDVLRMGEVLHLASDPESGEAMLKG
jgi:stage II sporulation protein AA (anti-sigma F factor antagonist)